MKNAQKTTYWRASPNSPFWLRSFYGLFVFLLLSFLFYLAFSSQMYHFSSVWSYRMLFVQGWVSTCLLSLACLLISFCIGLLFALLRHSSVLILRYLAQFYIETIRGTPLLVQLLFFFYVVASSLYLENRYWVGIVTLSIFSGAYIAEILRSGIENVRSSQLESSRAIGLTSWQTYRFVIFPLAFRQVLPPLAGQFASIIKDSSLLSILGISEFTYNAQQVSSATYSTLESYFPLAVGYLILTLPISLFSKYLERKYHYDS